MTVLDIKNKAKIKSIDSICFFLKTYPYYIVGIIVLALLASLFEALSVVLLFSVLKAVVGGVMLEDSGGVVIKVVEKFITYIPISDQIVSFCVVLAVTALLKGVFSYWRKVYGSFAGYRIWSDFQEKLFEKYVRADYQYVIDNKQGEIYYRVVSAPCAINSLFMFLPDAVENIAKFVIISIVLLNISSYGFVGAIVIGVCYYFFTQYVAKNISYNLGKGRIVAGEKQNTLLNEAISGIRQVKVYGSEKRWIKEFFQAMKDYFNLAKRDVVWMNLPRSLLEAISVMLVSVTIIITKIIYPGEFLKIFPFLIKQFLYRLG